MHGKWKISRENRGRFRYSFGNHHIMERAPVDIVGDHPWFIQLVVCHLLYFNKVDGSGK